MIAFQATHRGVYRSTTAYEPPECKRFLRRVGVVFDRGVGFDVTLLQCSGCQSLIALYCGRVVWEVAQPPAAMPAPDPARESTGAVP